MAPHEDRVSVAVNNLRPFPIGLSAVGQTKPTGQQVPFLGGDHPPVVLGWPFFGNLFILIHDYVELFLTLSENGSYSIQTNHAL